MGTQQLGVAFIKMSVCLKIPVCDMAYQNSGTRYDHKGNAKDCSGRGQCMWNMEKGNHCKCDAGYTSFTGYLDKVSGKLLPNESSPSCEGPNRCVFRQLCCRSSDGADREKTLRNCLGQGDLATPAQGGEDSPQDSPPGSTSTNTGTRAAADNTTAQSNKSKAHDKDEAKKAFLAGYLQGHEQGKPKESFVAGYHQGLARKSLVIIRGAAPSELGEDNPSVQKPFGRQRGDKKAREAGAVKEKNQCIGGNKKIEGAKPFSETIVNPRFVIRGPEMVSKRCKGLDAMKCRRKGCQISRDGRTRGQCVDPIQSQCAVQKKIFDCVAHRTLSFAYDPAIYDQQCGRISLKQKKQEYRTCSAGLRINLDCTTSKDCPLAPVPPAASRGVVGDKRQKYEVTYSKCTKKMAYLGCQAALQNICGDYGYLEAGGMAV